MPLHLRRRGEIWHARGTIRVGSQTVDVPSFSTGCRTRADAAALAEAREAEIRAAALDRAAGRPTALTFADCCVTYLRRPGGVKVYDRVRIREMAEAFGDRRLAELGVAWSEWLSTRGAGMAPSTATRWRAIAQAAIGAGCHAAGIAAVPRLPTVRQRTAERMVYLTAGERERLLAAYNPSAGRVALVLAYQGLRTQEALQLDWRAVSLELSQLRVMRSKSGRGRSVPMHPRVAEMLAALHRDSGRPEAGPVFLSERGLPYSDTRERGGNPLAKAHATACKRAGVRGFRVHDWRHDWAARMVMSGGDLVTLMRLGGWASLKMVQRYASVSADHMRAALERIA